MNLFSLLKKISLLSFRLFLKIFFLITEISPSLLLSKKNLSKVDLGLQKVDPGNLRERERASYKKKKVHVEGLLKK